jgi:hypothetical protein
MNLVSNAIKFTERGQVKVGIALATRSDRELVYRFCVSDTGIGIPRDRQGAIFRRFLQADPSTTRHYGGSGLGLTISARLVEMMQGNIWVESEPEKGSAFYFTARFTLQPETVCSTEKGVTEATAVEVDEIGAPRPVGERLDILLVEDNVLSQKLASHLLRRQGHEVWVADNGKAALEAYERRRFDLILMDVRMPRMDGLAATENIRQKEKLTGSHVPIIGLTANAMVGDREDCLQAGMDDCLIKPIHPAALLAAIERARAARAAHAELGPVLDRAALMERIAGDMRLLDAMKEAFRRDSARLLSRVRYALEQHDTPGLHQGLHTLTGMFRNLSAHAACDAAGRLQGCDAQGDPAGAASCFADLERQVELLNAALAGCHAWRPPATPVNRFHSAGDGRTC